MNQERNLLTHPPTHPPTHLPTCLLSYLPIHSFIHPFINPTNSFTYWFIHSFVHLPIHSSSHSFIHSCMHSFILYKNKHRFGPIYLMEGEMHPLNQAWKKQAYKEPLPPSFSPTHPPIQIRTDLPNGGRRIHREWVEKSRSSESLLLRDARRQKLHQDSGWAFCG